MWVVICEATKVQLIKLKEEAFGAEAPTREVAAIKIFHASVNGSFDCRYRVLVASARHCP